MMCPNCKKLRHDGVCEIDDVDSDSDSDYKEPKDWGIDLAHGKDKCFINKKLSSDCDHEFEKTEVSIFQNNPQTRMANICKHCGIEKEEIE